MAEDATGIACSAECPSQVAPLEGSPPPECSSHGHEVEGGRTLAESGKNAEDAAALHHSFHGGCEDVEGQSHPPFHVSPPLALNRSEFYDWRLSDSGRENVSAGHMVMQESFHVGERISQIPAGAPATHSSLFWQDDRDELKRQDAAELLSFEETWKKHERDSAMDDVPNIHMLALNSGQGNNNTPLIIEEKYSVIVGEDSVNRDDGPSGMQASEEEEDRARPSQEEKAGISDEANTGTSQEDKNKGFRSPSEGNAEKSGGKRKNVHSGGSAVKKTKKKNVNVWAKTTSRKGGKKNSSRNGLQQNKSGLQQKLATEDCVYLTPVYRNQDKIEDRPGLPILLSRIHKAEKVELSSDRLTAGSSKGYRMVKATRGVTDGAWYFEIIVEHLGSTGHTRLGWSTQKGDVQAPVGFDSFSYAYRDIEGSKVHMAMREPYGESYVEGDVIGFYVNLPNGAALAPKPPPIVCYKGQPWIQETKEELPKIVPGSEISFFRNGVCQGVAFTDINAGRYYPAASIYTLPNQPNCTVRFNFGPEFTFPPVDIGDRPPPRAMYFAPYCGLDGEEIPFESITGEHDGNGTSKFTEVLVEETL